MMQAYLDRIESEWTELITTTSSETFSVLSEVVKRNAPALSRGFYEVILLDPDAINFLTNDQVERQLKSAMENWLRIVLSDTERTAKGLISVQQHVGEVHARIGIPTPLIEMGGRTLKKLLIQLITETECAAEQKLSLFRFVVFSIDIAIEVMSRASLFTETNSSREDENYRIFSLLENAEEEKERQAGNLVSWEMDVVYKVMVDGTPERLISIGKADFGLWFNHKGRHYFSGVPEAGYILKVLHDLDELVFTVQKAPETVGKKGQKIKFLADIKVSLSQINSHLKTLFGDISRSEAGMDTLTRLLNRRFLPTIFRREIAHANRASQPLSVMIVDVDKFKFINDSHGHLFGDELLRKISQVFYDNVRANDYVFRFGGDEFLIVLTEAGEQETRMVAERIRILVSKIEVMAPDGSKFNPTISVGAAMFDGHPDYEKLIKSADKALYLAKAQGRNRVIM